MEPGGQRTSRFSGRQELRQGKYRLLFCRRTQPVLAEACLS